MFFSQKHEDSSVCHQHSRKELHISVHECVAVIPAWQGGGQEAELGGPLDLLASQLNPMGELQVQ